MTEIWQSYKKLPCWKKILLAFPMLIAFVGIGCMWLYRESHFGGNRLEQSRDAMEFLYETDDKRAAQSLIGQPSPVWLRCYAPVVKR